MTIHIEALLLLIAMLIYLDLVLGFRILINKHSTLEAIYVRNNKRLALVLALMKKNFKGRIESLRDIKIIQQTLIIDTAETVWEPAEISKAERREIKRLKARSPVARKEAATLLGLLKTEHCRLALEKALAAEKDYAVKIYISNALTDIFNPASLPVMIHELVGAHKWYREKAISNILEFGEFFMPFFYDLMDTNDVEHIELLIKFSAENVHKNSKAYLFDFVDHYEVKCQQVLLHYESLVALGKTKYRLNYVSEDMSRLLERTCRTLANIYYVDFSGHAYWNNSNSIIKTNAFWAASKQKSTTAFNVLLSHLNESAYERTLIATLSKMIEANPRFIYLIEEAFETETDSDVSDRLAQILSNKIEYYILKLNTKADARSEAILNALIRKGKINELIGFINKNHEIDLENRLVQILKEATEPNSATCIAFQTYLKPHFLEKWGIDPIQISEERHEQAKDPKLIRMVLIFTLIATLSFPLFFISCVTTEWLSTMPLRIQLRQYVIEFNYFLAYYSLAINLSYLTLLGLSFQNLLKQAKLWNLKNVTMLYRNQMIPSISIVAPAYNEEKTIIASARSLLNLNYPNYELVIVNDGSNDNTLETLITDFGLIRTDYLFKESLPTAPIRGIYRNPSYPKLVVVDKSNGGKADSLNAGINVANKEYYCGIDADSLLEADALLKLASLTLDESVETPALGGNVFPINGCQSG